MLLSHILTVLTGLATTSKQVSEYYAVHAVHYTNLLLHTYFLERHFVDACCWEVVVRLFS